MCRSIKVLRPPHEGCASDEDVRAAALQYVRKVAGMRQPSRRNQECFERAVDRVADATADLLAGLQPARSSPSPRSL